MVNLRIPMYIFILWGLAFVSANPVEPDGSSGDFLREINSKEGKNLESFCLQRFNDQNINISVFSSKIPN